ncbi:methyltransferase [Actinomadura sp. 7K534]|uniref:methyltransferase n=1 Tax=Actinomadura sp. 7K534 TaxID=2530366 RepID=UPI00104F4358|nr:methyltransferase [Actinomadura sp. 7K534]TDB89484.1 ArsR family transcriptional regulator [Actinomadura sp. 7K534]
MSAEVPESPLAVSMVGLLTGGWVAQAVSVAARLKIADHLARGPRSAADIAAAVGADAPTLHRLLRALSDVGVVQEREDGLFSGTPLGDLLRSDVPSLRGYALLTGASFHRDAWSALEHSVRTGEAAFTHVHGQEVFDHLRDNPTDGDVLNAAMIAMSGEFIAPVVAACDFSPGQTIVDVGGGHGVVLAEILAANPGTRGILYDLPEVVADAAGGPLREALAEDRCQMIGGSFFDSVPPDCDSYVLSHIVHDWDDDRAVQILAGCRRAMRPDSRVLVAEGILREGPAASRIKWLDLEMLVMTRGGRQRTQSEYEALFGRAGLRFTGIPAHSPTFTVLEARPA